MSVPTHLIPFDITQRKKELSEMRTGEGYNQENINFAWTGFFLANKRNFQDNKNIKEFVWQFNDIAPCEAIIKTANERIEHIRAEKYEEYWCIYSNGKVAAFEKFEDAAEFFNQLSKAFIRNMHTNRLVKLFMHITDMTPTQYNELMAKNHSNDVEYIAKNFWDF